MATLYVPICSGVSNLEMTAMVMLKPPITAANTATAPTEPHNLSLSIVDSSITDPANIATDSAISLILSTKVF